LTSNVSRRRAFGVLAARELDRHLLRAFIGLQQCLRASVDGRQVIVVHGDPEHVLGGQKNSEEDGWTHERRYVT
jgi:hypothetical protein